MKNKTLVLSSLALAVGVLAGPARAQTEIQWWHSMTAFNNEWVNFLAKQFNESQKTYKVVPIYKGSYDESMTAAIAAFRAGNAPHILQVFEVGTATMMASKGAIVPAGKVMADAGQEVRPGRLRCRRWRATTRRPMGRCCPSPTTAPPRSSTTTRMPSRPLALTPKRHPTTWPEVALAAAKLKASGHKCPLTIAWQGWTQLESFSAWHNVEFATQEQWPGRHGCAPGSRSIRHCMCGTSRTWPTWLSRACSSTRADATCRSRRSSAASAP